MNVEIRRATLSDIELLLEWRMTVLREVFSVPADDLMAELERKNRHYYQAELSTEGHVACFAYADNRIVGCGGICLYQELPSPDNPSGGCAYLMNIYTRPELRGQGVGREIVSWLIRQAKQRGTTKIYLETSKSGRPLYQEMGFNDMCGYMQYVKK